MIGENARRRSRRTAFLALCAGIALTGGIVRAQGTPPEAADRRKVQADFLAALNEIRKAAGVAPVVLDPALSEVCQAHAEYCVRNWKAHEERGKYLNVQQDDLPGYDAKVAKVARYCSVDELPPGQALERMMAGGLARRHLLMPDLKNIGMAWAEGGKTATITVVDHQSGLKARRSFPPVIWPPDGREGVPVDWVSEGGRLLPQDPDQRGGYPVTVNFPDKTPVEGVSAKLVDGAGKEVEAWVVSLETAPAEMTKYRLFSNDIVVIAKDRLAAATTYSVTVKAKVTGKAWSRTWTFTTVSK